MVSASLPANALWISLFNIMTITRSAAIVIFSLLINSLHSLSTAQNDYCYSSTACSTLNCAFIDQLIACMSAPLPLHLVSLLCRRCEGGVLRKPQAPLCWIVGALLLDFFVGNFPPALEGAGGKNAQTSKRVVSPTAKFQILNVQKIRQT